MITFGKLRRIMAENDITKTELSSISGVTMKQISFIFNDKEVSMGIIGKICSALNASYNLNLNIKDIMEYTPEEN